MGFLSNLLNKSESTGTVEKAASESYYGLSIVPDVSDIKIKYSGPMQKVDLEGSDVPVFVCELLRVRPSIHLLILPLSGLVISIESSSEFSAAQFRSPMNVDDSVAFYQFLNRSGKNIQMVKQYGAIAINHR